jgi:hypothetical protein
LHTHTLWSDGDDFPDKVVDWYKQKGYDFLAMTDHNVLLTGQRWMAVEDVTLRANRSTSRDPRVRAAMKQVDPFGAYEKRFGKPWVETRTRETDGKVEVRLKTFAECNAQFGEAGRFLLIHGEEITQKAADGSPVHVGALPLTAPIKAAQGGTSESLLRAAHNAVAEASAASGKQIFAQANHPNFYWGFTAEDLAAVPAVRFLEVANGALNDNDLGAGVRPSSEELWDIANMLRISGGAEPVFGVGVDDGHHYHGNKDEAPPGRAWVMVRSKELTTEALVAALYAGDFYFSTGVTLEEVRFDEAARKLVVRVRPEAGETYKIRIIGTRKVPTRREGKPRDLGVLEPGESTRSSLDYSAANIPPVGEVLAEMKDATEASYTLKGDELYVRVVVTSSAGPAVPWEECPFKQAWTQPVGWRSVTAK